MHYRQAGFAVFWIVVLVTLAWALYGRLDVAAVIFLSGLVFVEEAFAAARAQETAPFSGRLHLGVLDAKIKTESQGPLIQLEWEADFKDWQPPFVLRAKARNVPAHVRQKITKAKAKLRQIQGLQDVVVDGEDIAMFFRDEPGKAPDAAAALQWLKNNLR